MYETQRTLWPNVGGYEGTAIQMWLTGASKLQISPYAGYDASEEGLKFAGSIRVHEGAFIFGTDVTLTEKMQLTVLGGGSVQGKDGKDAVLSLASGVHENNGAMSLAATVKNGAVLKGDGTFKDVAVDGGSLIVGNSPGRQTYTGDLAVNLGEIIFSVGGWDAPAEADKAGWGGGAYSNIVMQGGALTLGEGAAIKFAVAGDALSAMFDNSASGFTMEIAAGFANKDYFSSELLNKLAQHTFLFVASEQGAVIANGAGLKAGDSLNTRITDLKCRLVDDATLCVSGVFMRDTPPVPEPAAGTLGLLALMAFASRRRRR